MATERCTLNIPDSLARELKTTNQEFLIELLERGLHALKIDRALDKYARGGITFGAAAHQAAARFVNSVGRHIVSTRKASFTVLRPPFHRCEP